jgi:hypothetical protein
MKREMARKRQAIQAFEDMSVSELTVSLLRELIRFEVQQAIKDDRAMQLSATWRNTGLPITKEQG